MATFTAAFVVKVVSRGCFLKIATTFAVVTSIAVISTTATFVELRSYCSFID